MSLELENKLRVMTKALNSIAQWHEGLVVNKCELDEPNSCILARSTLEEVYGVDYVIQKTEEAEGSTGVMGDPSQEVSDEERLFFQEINNPVIEDPTSSQSANTDRTGSQTIQRPDANTVYEAVQSGAVCWFQRGATPPRDSSQGG